METNWIIHVCGESVAAGALQTAGRYQILDYLGSRKSFGVLTFLDRRPQLLNQDDNVPNDAL